MQFSYQPDGGATYRTSDGDVLDMIAFNFYGAHDGTTALLYESNTGLAAVPQPYQAGLLIFLPPKAPVQTPTQIQLWE